MKFFILSSLIAVVVCQQAEYYLPNGWSETLEQGMVSNFICPDAGYYADVENDCQIYHICNEIQMDPEDPSNTTMYQYSYYCGSNSRFDQTKMVCTPTEDALPCEAAPAFYHLNSRIGSDAPFLTAEDILAAEENTPMKRGNSFSEQLLRDQARN